MEVGFAHYGFVEEILDEGDLDRLYNSTTMNKEDYINAIASKELSTPCSLVQCLKNGVEP